MNGIYVIKYAHDDENNWGHETNLEAVSHAALEGGLESLTL